MNDRADGEGEEEANSGASFYKGQFKNGKKGPRGYMRFGDANVYEGEFKDNAISGKGKITNKGTQNPKYWKPGRCKPKPNKKDTETEILETGTIEIETETLATGMLQTDTETLNTE